MRQIYVCFGAEPANDGKRAEAVAESTHDKLETQCIFKKSKFFLMHRTPL